ncbi:JAB domain-containing protein [Sphingomonas sp. GCM10030256]|uniref:JAB domain-containing protein n=1 Tax=Sphingomonas sp. GCM10030256 TaxID=3273427 RepID=UPI0036246456
MLQRAETPVKLAGVEASRAFFATCFKSARPQTLMVAHLDEQARCIHLSTFDDGHGSAGLPIREILADAARLVSAGIVLAHSQTGDPSSPDPTDRDAVRRLARAADAIDVTVVDHLVLAGERCSSFRRMGLL